MSRLSWFGYTVSRKRWLVRNSRSLRVDEEHDDSSGMISSGVKNFTEKNFRAAPKRSFWFEQKYIQATSLASRIERLYVEACLLYEDLRCWTISRGEFRCFKVLSLLRRSVSKLSLYFNLGDQKKKQPRIAPYLFRLMNAYLRLSVLEIENILVTRNSIRSPRPPLGLSQGGEIAFLKGL